MYRNVYLFSSQGGGEWGGQEHFQERQMPPLVRSDCPPPPRGAATDKVR